jgi:hypothetical protein
VAQLFSLGDQAMSDLPTLYSCFEPPAEQKVEPGQPADYVGVYCVHSHITMTTKLPAGFQFPKVEAWRPIFDCSLPSEIETASSGYFAIWFRGIPSERGRFGSCVREVRVVSISKFKEGRELRPDEYVR